MGTTPVLESFSAQREISGEFVSAITFKVEKDIITANGNTFELNDGGRTRYEIDDNIPSGIYKIILNHIKGEKILTFKFANREDEMMAIQAFEAHGIGQYFVGHKDAYLKMDRELGYHRRLSKEIEEEHENGSDVPSHVNYLLVLVIFLLNPIFLFILLL